MSGCMGEERKGKGRRKKPKGHGGLDGGTDIRTEGEWKDGWLIGGWM